MKIRTDFVTNSSSSSFVSYKFDPKLLNEFLESHGMEPFGKNGDWVELSGNNRIDELT